MSRKNPTKTASNVLVTFARRGAEREQRNASAVPVVLLEELTAASAAAQDFAMNLLAGKIDPRITEAATKRGGLKRMLCDSGVMSGTDVKALAKVLAVPVGTRIKGWEAHADGQKRFRGVSLQGIAKGLRLLEKPAAEKPAAEKPAAEQPAAEQPAAEPTAAAADTAELAAVSERASRAENAYAALVQCIVRAVSDPGMTPAQRLVKIKALSPIRDAIDAETP